MHNIRLGIRGKIARALDSTLQYVHVETTMQGTILEGLSLLGTRLRAQVDLLRSRCLPIGIGHPYKVETRRWIHPCCSEYVTSAGNTNQHREDIRLWR